MDYKFLMEVLKTDYYTGYEKFALVLGEDFLAEVVTQVPSWHQIHY
jgi:hypothetical protein